MHLRDLPQYECTLTFRVRLKDQEALYCAASDLITGGSEDRAYREDTRRTIAPDPATAMLHLLMRRHEVGPMDGTSRIGRTTITVRRLAADGSATSDVRSSADLRWDRT